MYSLFVKLSTISYSQKFLYARDAWRIEPISSCVSCSRFRYMSDELRFTFSSCIRSICSFRSLDILFLYISSSSRSASTSLKLFFSTMLRLRAMKPSTSSFNFFSSSVCAVVIYMFVAWFCHTLQAVYHLFCIVECKMEPCVFLQRQHSVYAAHAY